MPNYTTHYNLVKPTASELYDVRTFNENFEKVDSALHAIKNQQQILTHTSLSQLGLSGAVTTSQVFQTMPDCSTLIVGNTNNESSGTYISDTPSLYGTVELVKYSATRTAARFTRSDESGVQIYVGKYHSTDGWSGWFKEYNDSSKPSLAELGAASSAEQNTKHFTAFNQIGLVVGSESIANITTHLPNNGKISLNVTSGTNANIYPADYGSLEVHRITQYRVEWRFTAKPTDTTKTTTQYIGYSYVGEDESTVHWTGWQKLCTLTDVAAEIAKIADYDAEVF